MARRRSSKGRSYTALRRDWWREEKGRPYWIFQGCDWSRKLVTSPKRSICQFNMSKKSGSERGKAEVKGGAVKSKKRGGDGEKTHTHSGSEIQNSLFF